MLISLRHMCLPQNYIEKDKFIFVCRTLLDLICEKLIPLYAIDYLCRKFLKENEIESFNNAIEMKRCAYSKTGTKDSIKVEIDDI